jgi:hypothetical protein
MIERLAFARGSRIVGCESARERRGRTVQGEVRDDRVRLKPAQRAALEALANGDAHELTRARYEEITGVSRSQAAYDLAELVESGALTRVGAGRSTRYRLTAAAPTPRRRWTSDRIRAELTAFCSGRASWPSAAEFKQAGRSDLYVAASRYGGIGFWAAELGFDRSRRRPSAEARRRLPLLRLARPALAALLLLAVGAGAAGIALRAQGGGSESAAPARKTGGTVTPLAVELRSLRLAAVAARSAQAAASTPTVKVRRSTPRRAPAPVVAPPPPPAPSQSPPPPPPPELVANHPPAKAPAPRPAAPSKPATKRPASSWPSPLTAPASSEPAALPTP